MELTYRNKKKEKEILEIINKKYKEVENNKLSFITENSFYINEDNFYAMIKLLKNYKNKIDLIYIDPPYNTNLNFSYDEEKVSTISQTESGVIAYSDKMNLESYFEFMRERLILINQLLSDKGTLYIHIDDKIGHYIKILLDEIFGRKNFINSIARIKSNPKNFARKAFGNQKDVIYVYAKKNKNNIFNEIRSELTEEEKIKNFPKVDEKGRRYNTVPCHAPGETKNGNTGKMWKGIFPPKGRHWRYSVEELEKLDERGEIEWSQNNNPRIKKYLTEHKGKKIQDVWLNYKDPQYPVYPTEKNREMLEMIVLQSSNKDSIILDCFCGSGSFLKAGLKYGRKVIGIDKSEISLKVVKESEELKNIDIIENDSNDENFNQIKLKQDLQELKLFKI